MIHILLLSVFFILLIFSNNIDRGIAITFSLLKLYTEMVHGLIIHESYYIRVGSYYISSIRRFWWLSWNNSIQTFKTKH